MLDGFDLAVGVQYRGARGRLLSRLPWLAWSVLICLGSIGAFTPFKYGLPAIVPR